MTRATTGGLQPRWGDDEHPWRHTMAPRRLSEGLLAVYLLTLLWLTLFKLSYDIPGIIGHHQTRSVNVFPFRGLEHTGWSETVSNLVTFVPFGLLLSVNFKKTPLWRLLTVVLGFSVAVETLQFVLAIGTTDATDVVTNTVGGLTGLALYRLADQGLRTSVLDWGIAALGTIVFVAFVLLRLLVFQVRY